MSITTHEELVDIVNQLILKNNILEKKVEDLLKLQIIIPNSNPAFISPEYNFYDLPTKIVITQNHIESLKEQNMTQVMITILEEMKPPLPILCLTHKLYIYSEKGAWLECTNEDLIRFLNKIHQKFVKEMCEWYSANKEEINSTDQKSIVYNKMMIKLMGIEFKNKPTLSKIKSNLCKYLKSLG